MKSEIVEGLEIQAKEAKDEKSKYFSVGEVLDIATLTVLLPF